MKIKRSKKRENELKLPIKYIKVIARLDVRISLHFFFFSQYEVISHLKLARIIVKFKTSIGMLREIKRDSLIKIKRSRKEKECIKIVDQL